MKSFNLKKHIKTAFYEDDRGYWNRDTRCWDNCIKCKIDKGMGRQEAYDKCIDEYNNKDKGDWLLEYSEDSHACCDKDK